MDTNRENRTVPSPNPLKWASRKTWGTVGNTHYAEAVVGGDTYRYVIDQPRRGDWQARGWLNNSFFLFRDRESGARTLAEMKALIVASHASLVESYRKAGKL